MRSVNGWAVSRSYGGHVTARRPHQEADGAPSWAVSVHVTPPSECWAISSQGHTDSKGHHVCCVDTRTGLNWCARACTRKHKQTPDACTHTHCPLELPVVRLSSSCFSTHPHCCHSGQEAVGEIRMTKSLFIKLAECLECVWSLCTCVRTRARACVRGKERKKEKRSKQQRERQRWGWGPKPRAGGLSRIHSRLILGYCCLKPRIRNRGYNRIRTKRPLSYIRGSTYPLQRTGK